jgi:hypothetical protein
MHRNLAAREVYMASLSAMPDTASIQQPGRNEVSTIQSTQNGGAGQ